MLHPGQMHALFLAHGAHPWQFVPFEGAGHMDCYETHAPKYWPALKEFVDALFEEEARSGARDAPAVAATTQ